MVNLQRQWRVQVLSKTMQKGMYSRQITGVHHKIIDVHHVRLQDSTHWCCLFDGQTDTLIHDVFYSNLLCKSISHLHVQ